MDDKSPTETMNIALPEMLKTFVHEQVAAKGYTSASEYVRELIRAAQEQAAYEEIGKLVRDGINSGSATEVSSHHWDTKKRTLRERFAKAKRA